MTDRVFILYCFKSCVYFWFVFFFKQKTAYEMRISDWSSDVCSSDLTVDYQEKFYAGGRIPGGFFKREGRLTEKETLISRLIDRPIRPLFPDGFRHETQVVATVMSMNPEIDGDIPALIGASDRKSTRLNSSP